MQNLPNFNAANVPSFLKAKQLKPHSDVQATKFQPIL